MYKIIAYLRRIGKSLFSRVNQGVSFLEKEDIFIALVIVLVAFSSFGLGRLSAIGGNREPVKITIPENTFSSAAPVKAIPSPKSPGEEGAESNVLASKGGSKYYFPWCGGVSRIKKENLVSFATPREAEQSGYTLAANCAPR
ncbi:MAG: hypothetical protein AAB355_00200 [Patescibacteria group bacterium]